MSDSQTEAAKATASEQPVSAREDAIAVIGIGCRYADARGPDEFWDIVRSGRNTVRDAPEHRIELGYDIDHFYDPRPRIPGKISSKKGGFLEHPELFDPAAFGIAPRDAVTMEPQQRLMVEVTWDALEDAGIVPESIAGQRVAVILGYMAEDYSRERAGVLGEEAVYRGHDVFTVGGMSHAVLSGRIAFLLGVTGPSFTLDTACSSSLIATHQACQSLRRGESNLAIAGGVNLFLSPEGNIALSRSGMLSMSGACKAFDASADGFVRAEGAGVVVLKRLAEARADGDPIYAVIRGSGISTDGRDGGHMMAPGRKGQAQAMRDAYAQARVDPAQIQYVETHGTGTMIGDPVEIGALADVMGPGRDPDKPLLVASVKGNLGHTESASGVAGLIKACLAIRHRELPAQLHFETPNPMIPWDEIPVRVVAQTQAWPAEGPALVGVNSFGISGTNAHVVLESPPTPDAVEDLASPPDATNPKRARTNRPRLLPISAHDPNALHEMAEAMRGRLEDCSRETLDDILYTASRRRGHRAHRMAVVGDSAEALCAELDRYLEGESTPAVQTHLARPDHRPPLVMVFPGQGSQWLGMGRDLLAREPVFAEAIDRIDAAYAEHVDWSLRAVLEGRAGFDWTERLDVLQPALVGFEIALAALWAHFGVVPTRVVGQSMGEIAAAHVAGILDLPDVARLACHRGRIVARAKGRGGMAVVSLSRADVDERLARLTQSSGRLEVAGVNSPTTTIVSGDRQAVVAWVASLEAEGLFARQLEVDFASHCFHMDPLLEAFRSGIEEITPKPAVIPFDSTVDGFAGATVDSDRLLGPDYWVDNLRHAVAFDRGVNAALEGGGEIFLEVSPHPTLPRAIDEIAQLAGRSVGYVPTLLRREDESASLVRHLATLHTRGVTLDFEVLAPNGRVASMPLYAYQRERYWWSDRTRLDHRRVNHPLLGAFSDSSVDRRLRSWDLMWDADTAGFVGEIRLDGHPTAQVGTFLEMARAAADVTWPGQSIEVRDLELLRPLVLDSSERRAVQVVLRTGEGEGHSLEIASRLDEHDVWVRHARCSLVESAPRASDAEAAPTLDREAYEAVANEGYERALREVGLEFGPRSTTLRELAVGPAGDKESGLLGRFMLPRSIESEWHAFSAHPALVESALQLAGVSDPTDESGRGRAVCVESIDSVVLGEGLGSDCFCLATKRTTQAERSDSADPSIYDYDFFDRAGQRIARFTGVRVRPLPARATHGARTASALHTLDWRVASPIAAETPRAVERWIVISDDATEAGLLATELQKYSAECRFCEKVEDLEPLVRVMEADPQKPWGLVLLALRAPFGPDAPDAIVEPEVHRAYRVGSWADAIRAQTLGAEEFWIATRGLQSILPGEAPSQRAGKHVAREIETFTDGVEMHRCRFFDVSASLPAAERRQLAARMGVASEERQFVSRGGDVYVPRLVAIDVASGAVGGATNSTRAGARNFVAVSRGVRGGIGGLSWVEAPEPNAGADLRPGQIVVEVASVALTQLDVLTDLGLARRSADAPRGFGGDSGRNFGRDFAGRVVAIGSGVRDLEVGDEVAGLHSGALSRRLVVDRGFVARKPGFLDMSEAASLPFVSVVARYALEVVGRLRAGERVLVSGASGGVGRAMIGVARSLGAEVVATAGDARKRAALESLGIEVLDPAIFGGEGLGDLEHLEPFDVIVGAASGTDVHAMVARLASGGRYLDLCPRFDFERPSLGLISLGRNRSISAIDSEELLRTEPALVAALLERSFEEIERGAKVPMETVRFPIAAASRALRFMAQNRHSGRVCLDFASASALPIEGTATSLPSRASMLAGLGSCRLTGGAGPIRSQLAAWLRARGADEVIEEVIEVDSPAPAANTPELAREPIGSAAETTLAVCLEVASDSQAGVVEARERLADTIAAFCGIVSLRGPIEGDVARDRAWESRLWIDRLLLGERRGKTAVFDLSVSEETSQALLWQALDVRWDAHRSGREPVVEAGSGVGGEGGSESSWILLDRDELVRRRASTASPLFDELDLDDEGLARADFDLTTYAKCSLPERRLAMQAFVLAELASVLGLSEAQRGTLDAASRLDALGLDSLMSLELFMGLGRALELAITPDWFDSIPTIAEIATTLVERHAASANGSHS